jgi:protein-S-isoprenylcysteine O-methyltransferase Ste14
MASANESLNSWVCRNKHAELESASKISVVPHRNSRCDDSPTSEAGIANMRVRLFRQKDFEGKAMEAWKHLRAILLLPGMVLLVIPGTILWRGGFDTLGLWRSVPSSEVILPIIGMICVGVGLWLMVATIRLFVTVGQGTLAPWDPPQHLVVRGVYRHVRNPMISGVLFVLLGEAVLTASLPLLWWFLVAGVVNAVYIPLSEEPGLVNRFGDEYLTYKRHVPRWVPRLRAWDGESER